MSKELPQIVPSPPPQVDTFASYQTTREFYQEVQVRDEFERYCRWYHITAKRHRQELQTMRGEPNFLRFFRRR